MQKESSGPANPPPQQDYSAFVETLDNGSMTDFNHDISLFFKGKPLVMIKNFVVKRTSDFCVDQIAPLDRCLYRVVWEIEEAEENQLEDIEGEVEEGKGKKDVEGPEDADVHKKDRALLIVSPDPRTHPWVRALESRLSDFQAMYLRGSHVLRSIESLKETLQEILGSGILDEVAGSGDQAAHRNVDLMYVCEPVAEESTDMVHMLTEMKLWLDLVLPRPEGQKNTITMPDLTKGIAATAAVHHAFIITFGGNVDSRCPGATPAIGFGRTLQTEHAFDGVKCSLVDLEPLDECPAEESVQLFYEKVLCNESVGDEFEIAIRGGHVVFPRLKRIPFNSKEESDTGKESAVTDGGANLEGSSEKIDGSAPKQSNDAKDERKDDGEANQVMHENEDSPFGEVAHHYVNYRMKQGVVGDLNTLYFEACERPKLSDQRNAIVQVRNDERSSSHSDDWSGEGFLADVGRTGNPSP